MMKWTAITGLLLLLAACAVHDRRCDGALRPVNASAAQPPKTLAVAP
jgi:hypothetical protein